MGGMGIFRVKADGLNLGSVIETLNRDGSTSVMVQKFLPAIAQGDKRVLVINGQAVPFALARIPQGNEVRGNLAAGGKGVAQPLTERDWQIARAVGPVLAARGLLLVGLDIIGNCLTEVNVTSPTCFREITDQPGCDVPVSPARPEPPWPTHTLYISDEGLYRTGFIRALRLRRQGAAERGQAI
jgi:glutathione synthase